MDGGQAVATKQCRTKWQSLVCANQKRKAADIENIWKKTNKTPVHIPLNDPLGCVQQPSFNTVPTPKLGLTWTLTSWWLRRGTRKGTTPDSITICIWSFPPSVRYDKAHTVSTRIWKKTFQAKWWLVNLRKLEHIRNQLHINFPLDFPWDVIMQKKCILKTAADAATVLFLQRGPCCKRPTQKQNKITRWHKSGSVWPAVNNNLVTPNLLHLLMLGIYWHENRTGKLSEKVVLHRSGLPSGSSVLDIFL